MSLSELALVIVVSDVELSAAVIERKKRWVKPFVHLSVTPGAKQLALV